jgi:hypothetical protein
MDENEFIKEVIRIATSLDYKIEEKFGTRLVQIDFGNKKLHEGHLRAMFPKILQPGANVARLIEDVAPGRPCAHLPMKKILARLTEAL